MRRWRAICLTLALALLGAVPAAAWGPAAHAGLGVAVAQEMGLPTPRSYLLLQGVYGTGAPDLAWAADDSVADRLGAATHDDPGCLDPWLLASRTSTVEQAFAFG